MSNLYTVRPGMQWASARVDPGTGWVQERGGAVYAVGSGTWGGRERVGALVIIFACIYRYIYIYIYISSEFPCVPKYGGSEIFKDFKVTK